MMQRPIHKLVETGQILLPEVDKDKKLEEIGDSLHRFKITEELQAKNLKSALAFAALTTHNGSTEAKLYENVV